MASIGIVQDKDEHYACVSVADGKIIRAHNDCQAEKGDKVMVSCSAGRVFLYVFAIFVLPFFPAGAAFYLIYTVSTGFWLPSAAGLAVLAVFYLFLRLTLDKKAASRCTKRISRILEKADGCKDDL